MLAENPTIADDFPPVSYETWRALVERELSGAPFEKKLIKRTYEGIDLQPLYTQRDHRTEDDSLGFPGLPPFTRGARPLGAVKSKWNLRQEYANPEMAAANRAIQEDVDGGVTSVLLHLDAASRCGLDPDDPAASELVARGGVAIYTADDLGLVLDGIRLDRVPIALDAGAAFLPAAAMLATHWQRQGIAFDHALGAFNADPWAVLAGTGRLPVAPPAALAMLADLAAWTAKNLPHVMAVGVDTSVYHNAGATAAQDLAFGMATAIEYLRALTSAGLGVDAASRQIVFRISLGTHHFLAIAKLRAGRTLWNRVVEACGGSPDSGGMQVDARLSRRVMTERDPYVNMLRNTVGVFAAGVGGAETITSLPFDYPAGSPTEFGRRVARNTALILMEEAHLHRVVDPAGGSWFLDTITEQLAQETWKILQEVERRGGMLAGLQSGWIADEIDAAFAPRAKNIASRKEGITGVSEFPNVKEELIELSDIDPSALIPAATDRVSRSRLRCGSIGSLSTASSRMTEAVAAASQGASIGQLAAACGFQALAVEVEPITARSFAEPFEELRLASDDWESQHGRRPRVFLANAGPAAHHTARTTYATNFFEAGGFEVVVGNGYRDADAAAQAFAESGAGIAVICSSDQLYPDLVPRLAPQLKAAGARTVVLAGNPGANEGSWREAGVDRFIFIKCDVLGALQEMLREEGVLPQ